MYDVIIIGGGHNGLTCGAYLAREGRRVVVLERREIVGGMCTTEETVSEAPGYMMSPCAVETALTSTPRSVIDELGLHRYGLQLLRPDPWGAWIGPDGASIGLWRDQSRTVKELRRLSVKDADKFEWLIDTMNAAWWAAMPYFQSHPKRPEPRAIGEILWRAAKGRKKLGAALRVFASSPEQVLEEHFEREEVKAMLANFSSWSMVPLQEPGSAGVLAMMVAYFGWGVTRPVGGTGQFTQALARCIEAHGGEVLASAGADEVLVNGEGQTYGVRLHDGRELHGKQVIGACDPHTLMCDLVAEEHVPEATRDELRALGVLRYNITCLKTDVALSRLPDIACGRPELLMGYVCIDPTLEYVKQGQIEAMAGELPTHMTTAPVFPALLDPTQVPAGSGGQTVYLYMPAVPLKLSGGRVWEDVKEDYMRGVISYVDEYMPGLKDAVIGQYTQSPDDLAKKAYRGNVIHVDMSMHQMGPWRPTPSMSGYKTPIDGLWHTAAGAHPMGALNGWSGRTTARTVHRYLKAHAAAPHVPAASARVDNGRPLATTTATR